MTNTTTEIVARYDRERAALDAYSEVFEPSRKLQRDHAKALMAAVNAAVAAELEAIATRFEVKASDVAAWAEGRDDHDRLPGEGEAGAYATAAESLRKRIAELKSGVDESAAPAPKLIDPISAALSLLDRFETPGDRGRTLALISDLRQILAGA